MVRLWASSVVNPTMIPVLLYMVNCFIPLLIRLLYIRKVILGRLYFPIVSFGTALPNAQALTL